MIHSSRNRILTAVFVLTSLTLFNVKAAVVAGVDLGEAANSNWAIFTLGHGVTPNVNMSGQGSVTGDVGAAYNGNVLLGSRQNIIHGNLYYTSTGTLNNSGTITGSTFQGNDNFLNDAADDAQEGSDTARMMGATPPYQSLTNVNQSMTITGSGKVVLQLQNFTLSNGTFTLSGAAGTSFIINVSNQFSLSNSAQIVLSGGVRPQDVLFNVWGPGSQVNVSGSSHLTGVLLATQRTVSISGQATVTGEVIANAVLLSGHASVVTPTTNR